MFVDGEGDVHLISKGRTDAFVHYRIPASAWGKRSVVAEVLGTLPIDRGGSLGQMVTDAALSPDGRRVAVRTYQEVFLFRLTERGVLLPAGTACSLGELADPGRRDRLARPGDPGDDQRGIAGRARHHLRRPVHRTGAAELVTSIRRSGSP